MTRILYDEEEMWMEIKGHAGFAPEGEDIVCAAASCLAMTLLSAASEKPRYQTNRYIDRKNAVIRVWCNPEPGYKARCREMFRVLALGFELLANEYPDYVRMELRQP